VRSLVVEIRPAKRQELDPIWHLIVADDLNPQRDGDWFGLFDQGAIAGAAHLVNLDGIELLDDLWVRPERRRQGFGRALVREIQRRTRDLWLIADPDGVGYYEALGFQVESALPTPLATRYAALGLWPGHLGHLHVPMRWRKSARGERTRR
jgi:GNAT superfamily N-acetyltransferase